jgi:DNA replication and repair protein RecF
MAQSSRSITNLLYEHRRLLKQRNAGLALESLASLAVMEVWTQAFVDASAQLVEKRSAFLRDLAPLVQEEYAYVTGAAEEIGLRYLPDHVDDQEPLSVAEQLLRTSERLGVAERMRQRTLFGPQKDEVSFLLNRRVVRESASQGQHKSLLVALKLAEARLMFERSGERPVMLLDDVFSELDANRASRVLVRVLDIGLQCLITTTDGLGVLRHVQEHVTDNVVCVQVPEDVHQMGDVDSRVAA